MIERFRMWLHRECRLERSNASALISVGEQLAALTQSCRQLAAAVIDRPAVVTVLVMGHAGKAGVPGGVPLIYTSSARVGRRGEPALTVDIYRPMFDCSVVVICDLERVDVRGIFLGTDVLVMTGPIAYFKEVTPGTAVRVISELREAG